MIPTTFSDLGKSARDLHDCKFNLGKISVEHKTVADKPGIELKLKGDCETGATNKPLLASLETKHEFNRGIALTTKWDTKNTLTGEFNFDKMAEGHKCTLAGTFNPQNGEHTYKVKNSYKRPFFNGTVEFSGKGAGSAVGGAASGSGAGGNGASSSANYKPLVNASAVFGCYDDKPYVLGGEVSLDSASNSLMKHSVAVGYDGKNFSVVGCAKNANDFRVSLYHKISSELEMGVLLGYQKEQRATPFSAAIRQQLDNGAYLKARIDHDSNVGLVYGFEPQKGVKMALCGQLDAKNLNAGAHQLGLGLEFNL